MLLRPARSFTPTFTMFDALVFAAATVATDPIAVVTTFRTLKVPPRLAVLVEGESLFNDGTGVVVFNLVVTAAMGHVSSVYIAVWQFLLVSAGGALVGLMSRAWSCSSSDDRMIEVTLTVIAAYGSFAIAEQFGVSGAIATIVFLLIGMEVRLSELLADWKLILLGYAVITLVRFAIVSATSAALHRTREAIPWRWTLVIGWSGAKRRKPRDESADAALA